MLRIESLNLADVPWAELDAFSDRTIFETRSWLDFISETQSAEPIVLRLFDGEKSVGYFTGLIVSRFGFRILGSPFTGWTTAYMGFNLSDNSVRVEALSALRAFAFGKLGCHYLELVDRRIPLETKAPSGFCRETAVGFEIDLTQDESTLFGNMASACRRCIRKSEKQGLVVVEAMDQGFAAEYYAQLNDVFAKQALVPTYGLTRIETLVKHLLPTGRLLLLRALTPEGSARRRGFFLPLTIPATFLAVRAGGNCSTCAPMRPSSGMPLSIGKRVVSGNSISGAETTSESTGRRKLPSHAGLQASPQPSSL